MSRSRLLLALLALIAALTMLTGADVTVPPGPATAAAPRPSCRLNIVAHQDDDLLFLNPDVHRDVAAGRCIVTIFLTAGDAGRAAGYWRGREKGAMAAYARMAGLRNTWVAGSVTLAGHRITRVSLVAGQISLLFLRLPDGHGFAKHDWETLHKLWDGTIASIRAIDTGQRYTRESLTGVLVAAMRVWPPDVVRTMDYTGNYGRDDHGDHLTAAFLAYTAHQAYTAGHTFHGYRGYSATRRKANLSAAEAKAKMDVFFAYAPYDASICKTVKACRKKVYWSWFHRQHRVTGPPNLDGRP